MEAVRDGWVARRSPGVDARIESLCSRSGARRA
jgi:hypothetical protein